MRHDLVAACVGLLVSTPLIADEPTRHKDSLGDPLPPGVISRLGTWRWVAGDWITYLTFSPDGNYLYFVHGYSPYRGAECRVLDATTGAVLRVSDTRTQGRIWKQLAHGPIAALAGMRLQMPTFLPVLARVPTSRIDPFHISQMELLQFVVDWQTEMSRRDELVPIDLYFIQRPWETASGQQVTCADISRDGRSYYVAGWPRDNEEQSDIEVWDLFTDLKKARKAESKFVLHQPGQCVALRLTPDGTKLVALSVSQWDNKDRGRPNLPRQLLAIVWDLQTRQELRRFTVPVIRRPFTDVITDPPAYQFANMLVSNHYFAQRPGESRDTILVRGLTSDRSDWVLKTGDEDLVAPFVDSGIISFSHEGHHLVAANRNGSVSIWDCKAGKESAVFPDAVEGIAMAVALDPSGKRLAVAEQGGRIKILDVASRKQINEPRSFRSLPCRAAISHDGTAATLLCLDHTLRFFDARTGLERAVIKLTRTDLLSRLTVAPDGRMVVLAEDGKLKAWDIYTGKPQPIADVPCLTAWFSRGTLVLGRVGEIVLVDWPSGQVRSTLRIPEVASTEKAQLRAGDVAVSPDGKSVVAIVGRFTEYLNGDQPFASLSDCTIEVWDAQSGKHLRRLAEGATQGFLQVDFMDDGRIIYCGEANFRSIQPDQGLTSQMYDIYIIDPLSGLRASRHNVFIAESFSLGRHVWPPPRFAVSPSGRTVWFSQSEQGLLTEFELCSNKVRRRYPGHRGFILDLAWTPDGKRLLTASGDQTALVWDMSLEGAIKNEETARIPQGLPSVEILWSRLAEEDAAAAFLAMLKMAAQPKATVEFLRSVVQKVPEPPDEESLKRLVADLDSPEFNVRNEASRNLERFAAALGPRLSMLADLAKTADARKRIRELAAGQKTEPKFPAYMQRIRTLELLERLNTNEARELLTELASGYPEAALTKDAAQALRRLERFAPKP